MRRPLLTFALLFCHAVSAAVSVVDYGAVANDANDDAQAFRDALAADDDITVPGHGTDRAGRGLHGFRYHPL